MQSQGLQNIVIVGGGTAGWMTAAALAQTLKGAYNIRLVESDEIGIIGVGEATIPQITTFNSILHIDEPEFMRATQATFKLGIEFVNWGAIGDRYIHGFGKMGRELDGLPFHHFWRRMALLGKASALDAYSVNATAPLHAKFMRSRPEMVGSPLAEITYAYHFDAGSYAKYLRGLAEKNGVVRTEGKIVQVLQREPDGFIDAVVLENGEKIHGDLFVDCSGIRGLLIEETLQTGYEDWTHWLPCDRAIAVPCASVEPLIPLTRSTARSAGWQWRIPLQHRIGNGHVYSSKFMQADEAEAMLLNNLDGKQLADPRHIAYVPGRRKKIWNKNCVAIGLSAGFFEPIESTNIHLIQTGVFRLLEMFPRQGFDAVDIDEANKLARVEYECIRDFIILHYKATERTDSPFWNYCRTMDIPASLQQKMDLFASNGRIHQFDKDLFGEMSWLQVMVGQRIQAKSYHPFADQRSGEDVSAFLADVENVVSKCVNVMPTHAEYIAQYCAATPPA
ncbi:MAG: tryptophan halogenase family protein [Betaproteobacteria bacterium]